MGKLDTHERKVFLGCKSKLICLVVCIISKVTFIRNDFMKIDENKKYIVQHKNI